MGILFLLKFLHLKRVLLSFILLIR